MQPAVAVDSFSRRSAPLPLAQTSAKLSKVLRGNQRPTLHLVQGIFQLVQTIGGIDADHDGTDPRGGELSKAPLAGIRPPDPDPLPHFHPQGQQSAGEIVHSLLVLTITPAYSLVPDHEGIVVRKSRDGSVKGFTDGLVE